ncbi:MAG: TetR/AcrR family transcriptional regulator [Myxococcota bacterium]|nr:TetR/AcrR family transcriptional regulator [Myxococcota bacterium]
MAEIMRSNGEPSKTQRTRARLVAATRDEIAEAGSFTAERVANRAGTSVATFYIHLPTKDDALTATFGEVMDELVRVVEASLTRERLELQGLEVLSREFVDASLAFFGERSPIFRLALARMPEHRPLREVYRAHEAKAFSLYAGFIESGQSAGLLRAGDATVLTRSLLVLSQGLNNPLALGLEAEDSLRDELARLVIALLAPQS